MNEKTIKIHNPSTNQIINAIPVDIKEFSQRSNKIFLKDGTTLEIQTVISRVARVPNQWDPDGNPLYIVKNSNAITVLDSPDNLRKE